MIEPLFNLFLKELERLHLVVNEGKIVDASFIEVPIQRNTRQENKQIKTGEVPESFKQNSHRLAQKDTDALWTKKGNVNYFGYKNHVKQDSKSKLITKYTVTDASVHDSQQTEPLLEDKDKGEPFYGDSAYTGEKQEQAIASKEMENQVCEKGVKNRPLTEEQSTFKSRTYLWFYGNEHERHVFVQYWFKKNHSHSRIDESYV